VAGVEIASWANSRKPLSPSFVVIAALLPPFSLVPFSHSYQIERKCMSYGHLRTLMIIQGRGPLLRRFPAFNIGAIVSLWLANNTASHATT
jgi:hypothetical protein